LALKFESKDLNELSQDDGENGPGDESDYDEASEILEDIQEALSLARRQGVLPPVRIARILAGEGTGQFSSPGAAKSASQHRTVPLSVALDYVGAILDESRTEIGRLKSEVEEYNQLCNSMEKEVESLLRSSQGLPAPKGKPYFCALLKVYATWVSSNHFVGTEDKRSSKINVEEMYAKVRMALDDNEKTENKADLSREAFWREMDQTDDSFQTISRFFAKGIM
jgi:hypothetical protein